MTVVIDPPEYDLKNVLCEVTGLAMDADDVCFLKELQRAHDLANSAYFCADFRRLARKVALKYNLDASVLQEDYDG